MLKLKTLSQKYLSLIHCGCDCSIAKSTGVQNKRGKSVFIMALVQALTHIFAFHLGNVTGQPWREKPSSWAKQIWISNTKEGLCSNPKFTKIDREIKEQKNSHPSKCICNHHFHQLNPPHHSSPEAVWGNSADWAQCPPQLVSYQHFPTWPISCTSVASAAIYSKHLLILLGFFPLL